MKSFIYALLLLEMDDPARARPLLAEIVDFQDAHAGERPELDKTATVRQALAETYARSGELATAIAILRTALRVSETTDGAQHPETRSIRLSLAEALLSAELTAADRKLVEDAVGEPLAGLPDKHPFVAQRDRARRVIPTHLPRDSPLTQSASCCPSPTTHPDPVHSTLCRSRESLAATAPAASIQNAAAR